LASLTGVYGLSFLVAGVSGAVAYWIVDKGRLSGRLALAAAASLLVLTWGYGEVRLRSSPEEATDMLSVGLIQASVRQQEKWDPERAQENLERHIRLTREAAGAGARLVIWPESSVPGFFDHSPRLAAQLRALAEQLDIFLIFGNDDVRLDPEGSRRILVGAKMLAPDGELTLRYHKINLVPFGEYVPLKSLFTLGGRFTGRVVRQVADFEPGAGPVVARLEGDRLGVFICYEAIFPDLSRAYADAGAGLLVNITNDGWYGRSSAPYQHFAMARFRAVETGRYLARAANTGISAVIDPLGRVQVSSRLFEERVVMGRIGFRYDKTPYVRFGDVLAWSCLVVSLLGVGACFGMARRAA
jgi:apolipoprotein N-acyltransferase